MATTAPTSPLASASWTADGWVVEQPALNEVHPAFRTTPPSPTGKEAELYPPFHQPQLLPIHDQHSRDSELSRASISTTGSPANSYNNQSLSLNAILESPDAPPMQPSTSTTVTNSGGKRILIPSARLRSLSLDEVPRWTRRRSSSSANENARSPTREPPSPSAKDTSSSLKSAYFPRIRPERSARSPPPSQDRKSGSSFERPVSPLTRPPSHGSRTFANRTSSLMSAPSIASHDDYAPTSSSYTSNTTGIGPGDDEAEDEFFEYPRSDRFECPNPSVSEDRIAEYGLEDLTEAERQGQDSRGASPTAEQVPVIPSHAASLISLQSTTPSAFRVHPGHRVVPGELVIPASRWSSDSSSTDSQTASSPKASRRKASLSHVSRPRILSILKTGNPLLTAVKNGDLGEVQRVLGPGAQLNIVAATDKDGMTALHWAAREGHTHIAHTLLSHQAPLEACTKSQDRTPLFLAAQQGHVDIVELLVAAGADTDACGRYDGATALHKAAQNGHVAALMKLIQGGGNINHRDIEGMPPLMWATQGRSLETARMLIQNGANLETRIRRGKNLELSSREGITVLQKAVERSDHAFIELFLDMGADANCDGPYGVKPLHRAAGNGDITSMGMLLGAGASLATVTHEGWTPLHSAARYGHIKAYKMLVREGADEDATNNAGQKPRELGKVYGHEM